jgi:ABC-2 type transport system ATP-binding protein
MEAIAIAGLRKTYGRIEALRGVDLSVPPGTVFGLLGPNGAGKSTLIKALVGALRPSAGTVRVLGHDPLQDRREVRRQIGYMPQAPALYDDLSARANVAFFASAHPIADHEKRIDEVLALTELTARAEDPVHTYSGGMQRRVSLACALVHAPPLLFLDEPTAAVDPALRVRFWALFRQLATGGATLFISTHQMDEALLCDHVAVLRAGRIIACAPPREILAGGQTRLAVCRDGTVEQRIIGGHPADLAAALHVYGLDASVSMVDVQADSLETVLLTLIEKEGTP